nr:MAG TPA: hypothetical protein [Caudoviricetes sp.]
MILFCLNTVAMFIDISAAWWCWKKKDICGIILWCTMALIMAVATTRIA